MTSLRNQTLWRDWINQSLRETGWAPLVVFVVHVIALGAYDAYTRIPSFDLIMHFTGGLVMSYFFHRTSINASRMGILGPHDQLTHQMLVFTATCTVAVLWEFGEFILDGMFGSHSQAGLNDTMGDLLFGFLGAGVFTVLATVTVRRSYPVLSRATQQTKTIEALPGDSQTRATGPQKLNQPENA